MLHPWWPAGAPVWLHPHFLFESLAYFVGFQLFLRLRRRQGDHLGEARHRTTVIVAAVMGALVGSKLLFWLEAPWATWAHRTDPEWLFGGKTIVGGLLGGLVGVEWAKKLAGITRRSGDLFVYPLALGMAVGRIGCFLSGLEDGTHGVETTLPWGMDLGDGLSRHPTSLYEMVWLLGLAGAIWTLSLRRARAGRGLAHGQRFQLYLSGYLLWRLAAEFLKTQPRWLLGLSSIQWACIAGLAYYAPLLWRIAKGRS